MRISDMTTEQAFACMARMVPHVAEIERDEELAAAKEALRHKGGDNVTTGDVIDAVMPLMLGKHKQAVFGILGALEDKQVKEIAGQPYAATIAAVKADMTKEFFDFLPFVYRLVLNA